MEEAPYTKDFLHKEIQKFIRQYRDKPLMWMVNFTADVATALLVNNLAISEKKEEEPT